MNVYILSLRALSKVKEMILEMSEEKRPIIVPVACFCHDTEGYSIDFELPGVDKEHIDLSFCTKRMCGWFKRGRRVRWVLGASPRGR